MANDIEIKKDCNNCIYCIEEPCQVLKCGRKTDKTLDGHTLFAFCENERDFHKGECKEEGNFFIDKRLTLVVMAPKYSIDIKKLKAQKVAMKALNGNFLSENDREVFDEWKTNHSSDDVLNMLSSIGRILKDIAKV